MEKKIAVLLPYKDQFVKDNAGSASIWVKDFSKNSSLKKNTTVFGYTSNINKTFEKFKYVNLKFSNFGIQSKNLKYVNKFIDVLRRKRFSFVEIHNRPSYILHIEKSKQRNIKDLYRYLCATPNHDMMISNTTKVFEHIKCLFRLYFCFNLDKANIYTI